MRKIKFFIIGIVVLLVILICFYWLFFDNSILSSKYSNVESLSKHNIGGRVYNMTSKPIKVTDYKTIKILPPHTSSRNMGIFDVDSIIIDTPMYNNNVLYKSNVFKFCDYATIKVIERNNKTELIPSVMSNICRCIDDFDIYQTTEEAFK